MSRGKRSNKKRFGFNRLWPLNQTFLENNYPVCPNCGIYDREAHFGVRTLQDWIDKTPIDYWCKPINN